MNPTPERGSLLARLQTFGDPQNTWDWESDKVDYVAKLGVTPADVPELIAVARQWAEPQDDWPDDKNYVAGYAPIHAWRCLAQLRAMEALGPLLNLMDPLDIDDDDWYLEEMPYVFAWMGPEAIPPLSAYLADKAHEVYPRTVAARAIAMLAERQPETRAAAIRALAETLRRFEKNDESLNAFIISYLIDLRATEAAELIEQAYAADRVDLTVEGNWNKARRRLGVKGLGLVSEALASAKRSPFAASPPAKDGGSELDDMLEGDSDELPDDGYPESPMPDDAATPYVAPKKVGRNESCPCGSGKKYKKCCGR